jgi:phytoene synthase
MTAEVLAASQELMARKARTFYWASLFLPARRRADAAIVYAFCRTADDTADEARDARAAGLALDRLRAEVRGDLPPRPLIAAFRGVAARLDLPLASAVELIEGVRSDLGNVRISDDDELIRYCYRVASTVGLLMCGVLGVRSRQALPHALDLGVAMQLTNIVRDVAEDATLGRIYLPLNRLSEAGADAGELLAGRADRRAVARVVADVLDLADRYYRSADAGMRDIPWRPRQAILVASRTYRAIGQRLRRRGCDALAGRTVVPWQEKLLWGSRALAAGAMPGMLGITRRPAHDSALHRMLRGMPGANA